MKIFNFLMLSIAVLFFIDGHMVSAENQESVVPLSINDKAYYIIKDKKAIIDGSRKYYLLPDRTRVGDKFYGADRFYEGYTGSVYYVSVLMTIRNKTDRIVTYVFNPTGTIFSIYTSGLNRQYWSWSKVYKEKNLGDVSVPTLEYSIYSVARKYF